MFFFLEQAQSGIDLRISCVRKVMTTTRLLGGGTHSCIAHRLALRQTNCFAVAAEFVMFLVHLSYSQQCGVRGGGTRYAIEPAPDRKAIKTNEPGKRVGSKGHLLEM